VTLLFDVLPFAALVVATLSILLVLYVENERRPSIEFLEHHDEVTAEEEKNGRMWYHVKVRNKKPKFNFLNRDAALSCVARVEFLDKSILKPLPVGQIESKRSRRPEPRNYSDGKFDIGRVPACQRLDAGFGAEMFDVIMKRRGRRDAFATDPWIVYDLDLHPDPRSEPNRTNPFHEKWEKLRIDVDECLLRIEIEAINLGKPQKAYYRLRNTGTEFENLTIEKAEDRNQLS
jgi:hypothetical protein